MSEVKVTVICLAYNHEKWIRDALESFVSQRTPWPVEVLVHDDASTDGTADIIREYESRYPEMIYGFYAPRNRLSEGVVISREILYPYIRGEFVALCEGDDYWSSPDKLRLQVEALEKHPDADICACAARRERPDGSVIYDAPYRRDTLIPVEKVIIGGGGYVVTCSLLCRRDAYMLQTPMREALYNDFALQIQGSLRGGMVYLGKCMAVYRQGLPGSWTRRHHGAAHSAYRVLIRNMLRALDSYTGGRYSAVIERRISLYDSDDMAASGQILRMLAPRNLPVTLYQIRRNLHKLWMNLLYRL
ncbi:MAG: glycosyltransferase [Bacteroidales bacterium]|nr:glycosyltransferase [Bacteroidales bacterium]